jgi:hypothetical protein
MIAAAVYFGVMLLLLFIAGMLEPSSVDGSRAEHYETVTAGAIVWPFALPVLTLFLLGWAVYYLGRVCRRHWSAPR